MHFAYTLNQFNTVIYGMENITKEEIDQFIDVCKKGDDFLDAFFG